MLRYVALLVVWSVAAIVTTGWIATFYQPARGGIEIPVRVVKTQEIHNGRSIHTDAGKHR